MPENLYLSSKPAHAIGIAFSEKNQETGSALHGRVLRQKAMTEYKQLAKEFFPEAVYSV